MRQILRGWIVLLLLAAVAGAGSAQAKAGTLKCVGLYSETSDGTISFRVGTGAWVAVKVGDTIPANGEIKINVDRDWVELIPATNPNVVYEIDGPATTGTDIIKKAAEILKGKPRAVSFPNGSAGKPDAKFANKLVVTQYLGRQNYLASPDADDKDIKYGDVLDIKGKVSIIAINNTINLMNASGQVTTVIGPLKFDVEKVLTNQKLYKFLNVPR
jgi:hypothetical protein